MYQPSIQFVSIHSFTCGGVHLELGVEGKNIHQFREQRALAFSIWLIEGTILTAYNRMTIIH